MTLFQPAAKEKLKARVAIDGPTGAGKTWTALQLARILAGPDGKIGLIDTENRSAAYYAPTPGQIAERIRFFDPPYEFGHLPWEGNYDPRRLVDLMQAAAEELGPDGVLVIDSLTHFWTGKGGTLDVVDGAAARSGNSYTGWKEGTPVQRNMLDAIIWSPCHVVVTMRSKMEYILQEETNRNGRTVQVPTKVGMAPEQRAGVEYEFTVVGDMDLEHRLTISKSRCDLLDNVVAVKGTSWEAWDTFAKWLDTGVERIAPAAYEAIAAMIADVKDQDQRNMIRRSFKEQFGNPADLYTTQLDEVYEWLNKALSDIADPPAGTDTPPDGEGEKGTDDPPTEPPADQPPARARKTGGAKKAAANPEPTSLADALADAAPPLDDFGRDPSDDFEGYDG